MGISSDYFSGRLLYFGSWVSRSMLALIGKQVMYLGTHKLSPLYSLAGLRYFLE